VAKLRPEGLEFVQTAPKRWMFEAIVDAPRERVFAAISADPSTWKDWFPGFSKGGYVGKPGLDCGRWVRVGGTTYRETMVAWDEPSRWTYRVDSSTVPLARALVEDWYLEELGDRTVVRWTFAVEPAFWFRAMTPFVVRVMARLFKRAMRNLSEELASG
jgi:carbon monoxide dehydrogenase subunit G